MLKYALFMIEIAGQPYQRPIFTGVLEKPQEIRRQILVLFSQNTGDKNKKKSPFHPRFDEEVERQRQRALDKGFNSPEFLPSPQVTPPAESTPSQPTTTVGKIRRVLQKIKLIPPGNS